MKYLLSIAFIIGICIAARAQYRYSLAFSRSGVVLHGKIYSLRKINSNGLPYSWTAITSRPPSFPVNAEGARGVTDTFNEELNNAFEKQIVSGKNDSEVYTWVKNDIATVLICVHYKHRYYTYLFYGKATDPHYKLPPFPGDPANTPMK